MRTAIAIILVMVAWGLPVVPARGQVHAFEDADLNSHLARVEVAIVRSDLIFAGLVTNVGKPPWFGSGKGQALQAVTYTVLDVLKGSEHMQGTTVTVHHNVISGSRSADVKAHQLSHDLFRPGSRLIVMAREERAQGTWVNVDEDFGTVPWTENNFHVIGTLIAKQ